MVIQLLFKKVTHSTQLYPTDCRTQALVKPYPESHRILVVIFDLLYIYSEKQLHIV